MSERATTPNDLIIAAKIYAAEKRPYMAAGLHAMIPIAKPGVGTMAVDQYWRWYYDPALLGHYETKYVAGMLTHELYHLLRDHHARTKEMQNCNTMLMNICQDLEINDDIIGEKDYGEVMTPLPEWVVQQKSFGPPAKLAAQGVVLKEGQLAETYYRQLKDVLDPPQHGEGDFRPGGGKCGSCATGESQPFEDPPPMTGADGVSSAEAEMIRRHVAMEVDRLAQSTGRGTIPAGLARWAKDYLNPKVNYARWVRAALRNGYTEARGKGDFTFSRPSRRQEIFSGFGNFVMPSLVEPRFRAGFIIDTSGSMGQTQLDQAMAEIRGFVTQIRHGADLYVGSCDAQLATVLKVESASQVRMYGGGGTDMRVAFEGFEKLKLQMTVCITDQLTPWPEVKPRGIVVIINVGAGSPPPWPCHVVNIPTED